MIINTRCAGGNAGIPFGAALTYDTDKNVVVFGTQSSNNFIGVAGREVKSSCLLYTSKCADKSENDA